MAAAADQMMNERYSKLLPRRKGLNQIIRVAVPWARIYQDVIWNIVSINRLANVAETGIHKLQITTNTKTNTDTSLAHETSTKKEITSLAVDKVVRHKDRLTEAYYTVRWYCYWIRDDTDEPAAHIPHHHREVYWRKLWRCRQDHKFIRSKITLSGRRYTSRTTALKWNHKEVPALQPLVVCTEKASNQIHQHGQAAARPRRQARPTAVSNTARLAILRHQRQQSQHEKYCSNYGAIVYYKCSVPCQHQDPSS